MIRAMGITFRASVNWIQSVALTIEFQSFLEESQSRMLLGFTVVDDSVERLRRCCCLLSFELSSSPSSDAEFQNRHRITRIGFGFVSVCVDVVVRRRLEAVPRCLCCI